jgi:hypothetical protein
VVAATALAAGAIVIAATVAAGALAVAANPIAAARAARAAAAVGAAGGLAALGRAAAAAADAVLAGLAGAARPAALAAIGRIGLDIDATRAAAGGGTIMTTRRTIFAAPVLVAGMVILVPMPMSAFGVSRGVAGGQAEPGQQAAEEATAGAGRGPRGVHARAPRTGAPAATIAGACSREVVLASSYELSRRFGETVSDATTADRHFLLNLHEHDEGSRRRSS